MAISKEQKRQSTGQRYQKLSVEERSQLYRKRIAYYRKYNEDHKVQLQAYFRCYYRQHKDAIARKNNDRRLLRRAVKAGVFGEPIDRIGLYERDRGICGICRKWVPKDKISIDHIVPISRGGTHTWDNVQIAHISCNRRRNDGLLPGQLRLGIANRKRQSNYKLNEDSAKRIRKREKPVRELAKDFGVAVRTIYDVLRRKSWNNA